MSLSKLIARARALYARLSKDARSAVEDAAKYAGAAAATLGSLAAVLPALHVPAADTAIVASAGAALTGFVSWAVRKKLAKPAAVTVKVQAHVITDVETVAKTVADAVTSHLASSPAPAAPSPPAAK